MSAPLEALALVAARAQWTIAAALGTPASATDAGPLANALDRMLRRLGLSTKDKRIPDVLREKGLPQRCCLPAEEDRRVHDDQASWLRDLLDHGGVIELADLLGTTRWVQKHLSH